MLLLFAFVCCALQCFAMLCNAVLCCVVVVVVLQIALLCFAVLSVLCCALFFVVLCYRRISRYIYWRHVEIDPFLSFFIPASPVLLTKNGPLRLFCILREDQLRIIHVLTHFFIFFFISF